MVYYKGAVSYSEFNAMPVCEILNLRDCANKLNKEINKEQKKASR